MRRLAGTRILSESDKQLMLEVRDVITRLLPDAEVVLYGSAARGERKPDSDYDVLVLTTAELSSEEKRAVQGAVYGVEVARSVVISVAMCSRDEWNGMLNGDPFRESVVKEGIAL